MNVRLVSIEQDGIVRLAADGAMTASEMAGDDRHLLAASVGDRWASTRVVLSLARTDYIDSTAIGWLLSCKKQFDREGGWFVLHSIPPSVQQIFDMLKVGRVLSLARDEREALALIRGEGKGGEDKSADAAGSHAQASKGATDKAEQTEQKPAAKRASSKKKTTKSRTTKKKASKAGRTGKSAKESDND